jgi:DICT domain-containing protein
MYDFAQGLVGDRAEKFGSVAHVSRREFAEHVTFTFRAPVPALEYISLLIENALLLRTHRGGRVYAGFEKLSLMEGVVDRYMRIADVSERVYVFGEPDWQPPRHPNLRVVALAEDVRLAREWFVVADSPSLRIGLVAVDDDGFDAPDPEKRNFRALKTSDPAIILRLVEATESLIDRSLAG